MANKRDRVKLDSAIFKLRTALHDDTRSDEDNELIKSAMELMKEVRDGKR